MKYFNLIFTNHALQRIGERGLTKALAWETFNHPDESKKTKNGATQFIKHFDGFKTGLIAKQNDKNEWVVISFFRNPPLPGTKSNFWGKIWIIAKQQLGVE
mgnify:CR=1 FL=1